MTEWGITFTGTICWVFPIQPLVQERHGMSFPYSGNVSFHSMHQSMEQEIRQKYTRKPTAVIIINWIMLVLALWWTFFGLILWLVLLCLSARPKKIAGAQLSTYT